MQQSIYRIVLDLHELRNQLTMNVIENDTKRKLVILLSDGVRQYQIGEDCSAVFKAKKPDGTILFNECEIVDNTIVYELTEQTTSAPGKLECEVTLFNGQNRQITSPRFSIFVGDSVYPDSEVESSNEFSELIQKINEANNLNIDVEKVGDTAVITITKKDGTVVRTDIEVPSEEEKAAWDAKYDKPEGGIPKSDLDDEVNDLLDRVVIVDCTMDDYGSSEMTLSDSTVENIVLAFASGKVVIVSASVYRIIITSAGTKLVGGNQIYFIEGSFVDYLGLLKKITYEGAGTGTVLAVADGASNKEDTSNKTTTLSSDSTNAQYPSAKAVFDFVNNAQRFQVGEPPENKNVFWIDNESSNE